MDGFKETTKYKAVCGLDYIRGQNFIPLEKTSAQWVKYALKQAKGMSKRDNFRWNGVVCWIESRQCFRVNFGAMDTNPLSTMHTYKMG